MWSNDSKSNFWCLLFISHEHGISWSAAKMMEKETFPQWKCAVSPRKTREAHRCGNWVIRHINKQMDIKSIKEEFDPSGKKTTRRRRMRKNEQLILGYKILIRLITKFQLLTNTQRVCIDVLNGSEWVSKRSQRDGTSNRINVDWAGARLLGLAILLITQGASKLKTLI